MVLGAAEIFLWYGFTSNDLVQPYLSNNHYLNINKSIHKERPFEFLSQL